MSIKRNKTMTQLELNLDIDREVNKLMEQLELPLPAPPTTLESQTPREAAFTACRRILGICVTCESADALPQSDHCNTCACYHAYEEARTT